MPEIGFDEIISFLKKYGGRIIVFGLLSLLITGAVIAASYFLLPKKEVFISKINLLLPKKGKALVYPSTKEFSAYDIVSIPVLRKVYVDNNLKEKIKFDDFCRLFFLSSSNMKKALLAASFREKLNSKKISVIELRQIEREYEEALRNLSCNVIEISMKPSSKFNKLETIKILNDIPAAWFAIFSRQEAKALPRFESTKQIKSLRNSVASDGWLMTLDKARIACCNLQKGCDSINEILAGQKVALPSGEYLADLQEQLTALQKNRITPILTLVLSTPALYSSLDKVFLQANVKELERAVTMEQAVYNANAAAINILRPTAVDTVPKSSIPSNVEMKFDGGFLASVSDLILSAQSIKMRETYAENALESKKKLAGIEAEKNYYSAMLKLIENPQPAAGNFSKVQIDKVANAMFDELLELCSKTHEFRELIYKNYLLDRQFFTSTGEVLEMAHFYIPFKRVALGLIALCVILNLCSIGCKFYGALNRGELKR